MLAGCAAGTQRATLGAAPPAVLPLEVQPAAKDYDVDIARSRFEVWGTDVFGTDHRITFGAWRAHVTTGDTVTIDADVDVMTASVDIEKANDLLRYKLLAADRYPHTTLRATMRSTGKKKNEVIVSGTTELHGVKKALTFTGLLRQDGPDFRFNAAFVLDRQTFGIHYGPVEPFLKDDVRIVIAVVARPTAEGASAPLGPADAEPGPPAPKAE